MAGALGAAAQQALKNREAEEAKLRALEQRKKMEAMMRKKCEEAEPGSARARRCAAGTYPGGQSVAGAAGASGSGAPVPLRRAEAEDDSMFATPEPQSVTPADEKEFRTRAAERFGSAEAALKSADLEGDGTVSREELEKFMTEQLGFTPEEARKLADELLKKYDADGDGKLTAQQFQDILKGLGKKGGASAASAFAGLALAFLVRASLA